MHVFSFKVLQVLFLRGLTVVRTQKPTLQYYSSLLPLGIAERTKHPIIIQLSLLLDSFGVSEKLQINKLTEGLGRIPKLEEMAS